MSKKTTFSIFVLTVILLLLGISGIFKIREWVSERQLTNFLVDWDPSLTQNPQEFIQTLNQKIRSTDNQRSATFVSLVKDLENLKNTTGYGTLLQEEEFIAWAEKHQGELNSFQKAILALEDLPQGWTLYTTLESPLIVNFLDTNSISQQRTAVRALLHGAQLAFTKSDIPMAWDYTNAALFVSSDLARPIDSLDHLTRFALEGMIFYFLLENIGDLLSSPPGQKIRQRLEGSLKDEKRGENYLNGIKLSLAFSQDARNNPLPEKEDWYTREVALVTALSLRDEPATALYRRTLLEAKTARAFQKLHQTSWPDKLERATLKDEKWREWNRRLTSSSHRKKNPPFARQMERQLRLETKKRLIVATIKLIEHAESYGEFPESLDQLTADLAEIPIWIQHPEGGLFSYEVKDHGFVLDGEMSFPRPERELPLRVKFPR